MQLSHLVELSRARSHPFQSPNNVKRATNAESHAGSATLTANNDPLVLVVHGDPKWSRSWPTLT